MSEIDTESEEFQSAVSAKLEEEAAGLKSALQKERARADAAEKAAKRFTDDDIAELQQLREAREKAETEEALAAQDWKRLEQKMREDQEKQRTQWEKEIEIREGRISKLTTSLESALIEAAATQAINAAGADVELLLPHVQRQTKILETDGKAIAVVLGLDGEPRLADGAKNASDYMPVEALIKEWQEQGKYAGAFGGTGASGGGASASRATGGSGAVRTIDGNDPLAFGRHSKEIAAGKVKVKL